MFLVLLIACIILCVAYALNRAYGEVVNPMILRALNRHQLIVFMIVWALRVFDIGESDYRRCEYGDENYACE